MTNEKVQYHIQLKPGDIGRYVLLPGDSGRCEKIAAYFEEPRLIAQNREYTTYTGCQPQPCSVAFQSNPSVSCGCML